MCPKFGVEKYDILLREEVNSSIDINDSYSIVVYSIVEVAMEYMYSIAKCKMFEYSNAKWRVTYINVIFWKTDPIINFEILQIVSSRLWVT